MQMPRWWRRTATSILLRVDERLLLMIFGVVVGLCACLASVALTRSIHALEHALLAFEGRWWAFLLPAAGALLSAVFLRKIAREDPGHGVPEVIFSVSKRGGLMRFRSSFSRLVSSCLTIGSGGSAGPEAPVVMSGAAIGSNIAQAFSLNDRHRSVLVGCGAAAAIAAIFNAPIAGIVFSLEVILGEWSRVNIVPIALAAVAGTELSRALQGNQIPFAHTSFHIDTLDIVASAGLGLAAALAAVLLTRMLRFSHAGWGRLPIPPWWRAAAGGAVVGLLGLGLPAVLGEGYPEVRSMIQGQYGVALGLVAVIAIGKIVATSITLGSGGSGGIFAPSLVVGSLVGLGYSRLLAGAWPGVQWVPEGCFALLGMAGLVSGMLQAPLTGIFLVVEITGSYNVILPLIVVSVVAATLSNRLEPSSFYLRDLVRRGHLARPGTDARVLSDLRITELLETDCMVVPENQRLGDFVSTVQRSHRNYFPVESPREGRFVGMIHLDDVRPYLFDPTLYDAVVVGEIMDPEPTTVDPATDLTDVLELMDRSHQFSLPVVDRGGRFLGMISKATILDQYRRELIVQTED